LGYPSYRPVLPSSAPWPRSLSVPGVPLRPPRAPTSGAECPAAVARRIHQLVVHVLHVHCLDHAVAGSASRAWSRAIRSSPAQWASARASSRASPLSSRYGSKGRRNGHCAFLSWQERAYCALCCRHAWQSAHSPHADRSARDQTEPDAYEIPCRQGHRACNQCSSETAMRIPKPCAAGSIPAGGTYAMSRDTVHTCLATSFTVWVGVGSPGGVES